MLKEVIVWVLLIGALIILFIFMSDALSSDDIDPELVSCAEQVKSHERYSRMAQQDPIGVIDETDPPSISCPTQERTYEGDREAIFSNIGRDMVSCHELWDGGDAILFDQDGIYCHVCSLTTIESEESLGGLGRFLLENPVGESFAQQMMPVASGEQLDIPETTASDALEPGGRYATIFYYARGERAIEFMGERLVEEEEAVRAGVIGAGATTAAAACLIPGLGWVSCTIGATVGAAVGLLSWLVDYAPEYASSILFLEWTPENVERLGCEYSFASS